MNSNLSQPSHVDTSAEPGPCLIPGLIQSDRPTHTQRLLSENTTHEMIIAHRPTARKLARYMLKRWNARLEQEEIDSVADLALCEAARGFNAKDGTTFSTYLFYFLKGLLIKSIRMNKGLVFKIPTGDADLRKRTYSDGAEDQYFVNDSRGAIDDPGSSSSSPERYYYLLEIRKRCNEALMALSELEREVVVKVHVFDYKVATVARRLGYSRGHTSNMRKVALRKMQNNLTEFDKQAA